LADIRVRDRDDATGAAYDVAAPGFRGGWDNPITIGADPGCTVVLSEPGVAPLHARVFWLGIHRLVEALAEGVRFREFD
jgi:hypothetical protein